MRGIIFIFLATAVGGFAGPNLVQNFSFENFNAPGVTATAYTGTMSAPSVAANWNIWNNTNGTTTTLLCPDDPLCPVGPAPIDGQRMIYVDAAAAFNGIWQAWDVPGSGSFNATTSLYIYIVTGQVMVGAGDDGSTVPELIPATTGTWLQLSWFNSPANSPVNELVIYSYDGPAQFFVDAVVVVDGVPEPATFALTGLALVTVGLIARKRSRRL